MSPHAETNSQGHGGESPRVNIARFIGMQMSRVPVMLLSSHSLACQENMSALISVLSATTSMHLCKLVDEIIVNKQATQVREQHRGT